MILGAFLLGLFSSLHCVGMCGPIVMMLPLNHKSKTQKYLQLSFYHIGKLLAYTILGLLFGLFGKGLYLAGLQQNLSIILGIAMIVFTLVPEKKLAQINLSKPIYKLIQKVKSTLGQQFHKKSNTSLFLIGTLNGFLPCALVYIALFGATSAQSLSQSVAYMASYGLGTIPLLTLVALGAHQLKSLTKTKFFYLIPIFSITLGLLFIIRGLGLAIPYVSPSVVNLLIGANVHCY